MGDEFDPASGDGPTAPPEAGAHGEAARGEAEAPSFEVPSILQNPDPRELMRILWEEDPLELRSRCARRLRERAAILSPERLVMQTMARVAVKAGGYGGEEPLCVWIEGIVHDSVEDMLEDQRAEERRGVPVADSEDAKFYAAVADILNCPLPDSRMACVTLNGMSAAHREAFHAVLVQGLPLATYAQSRGLAPSHVRVLLSGAVKLVQDRLSKRARARRRRLP